jgi:hypothetical protein
MEIDSLLQMYYQQRELYEEAGSPEIGAVLNRITANIKTLELFNIVVYNALRSLDLRSALMPGVVPIMMLMSGMLPIPASMQQNLQQKFLHFVTEDPYIAKQYKNTLIDRLHRSYESSTALFAASFINAGMKDFSVQREVFKRVFSAMVLQNKPWLHRFIMNDAMGLRKQISPAVGNPLHTWDYKSYPVSQSEFITEQISGIPESLKKFNFSAVIPWRENQIGQTCKLHAFHSAAWLVHLMQPSTTPCLPPIHPNMTMPDNTVPLIAQARHLFASQVGEVYSPNHIMQLAKANHYQNVHMLQPTVENYIHQLKDVIDQGYFALVYFDVVLGINNPRLGFPDMQGSKYEHSAVLFGYMTTESNRDYFYAYQWDKYFTMNATNLLASTNQLQRRNGEVFYDIGTGDMENWVELNHVKEHQPGVNALLMNKQYRNKLFAPPPAKDLPTFRNCIIAMGPNREPTQNHDDNRQKNSNDNDLTLAVSKLNK